MEDQRIRVLHVETGRNVYGGAAQVLYLLKHLVSEGIEPAVLCTRGSDFAAKAKQLGVTVFERPCLGDVDMRLAGYVMGISHSWHPDIIHIQSRRGADTWGLLGARLTGAKVILSRRVDNWEPALIGRIRFGLCHHVICVCEGIREVLLHMGVAPSRMSVVHSAIEPERFQHPASREELCRDFNLPESSFVLGIAAQLIHRKGHRHLFKAIHQLKEKLPQLRLLVFGKGSGESVLRELAASLDVSDQIVFAGFREDLPRWIGALDLHVLPSDTEGLGNVLLQAAAAGVPSIGTQVGGIPEAMGFGKTGILVPVGDADAIATAIHRLATDKAFYDQCSQAGPGFVRGGFTPPHLAAGNAAVYRRILTGKSVR